MADDSLLLNFAAGDSTVAIKPTYRGGHWKERLQLNRNSRRHQKKANSQATLQDEPNLPPPSKRQRLSNDREHPSVDHVLNARLQKPLPHREVISSLFTYNPKTTSTTQNEDGPEVSVEPSNAPLVDGIDTFTSLNLSSSLAAHLLTKMSLKAPTAIQKSVIPQLIGEDADAFIQAETGSGKTLAYLLPIVHRVMELSKKQDSHEPDTEDKRIHRNSGLFAIILVPTRELAKQVSVVLEETLRCANWIVAGTVTGGESKKSEKARIRKGLNILVATPGRLVDHLSNTETLDISAVRWLILDEGDRLMELGFEDDIRTILTQLNRRAREPISNMPGLPAQRITVLCSATMKTNVERLGEMSLKDAVHLKADEQDIQGSNTRVEAQDKFSAPSQLKQSYAIIPPKQRLVALAALLRRTYARKGSVMKTIIFISCADSVDFHFAALTRADTEHDTQPTTAPSLPPSNSSASSTSAPTPLLSSPTNPGLTMYKLHGSLPQSVRTSTLKSFSKNEHPSILICTDVASRGLDLPSIDLVIEYDPAFSAEDHLHRIGRTARAGRDGRATIFLMPGPEEAYVDVLKQSYKHEAGAKITRTEADEMLKRGFTAVEGPKRTSRDTQIDRNLKVSWEDEATDFQLDVERWVVEDEKAGELARKAYISHVRAYATHTVSERGMFDVKELHLGHLAKAFALRDRPGNMGRGQPKTKMSGGSRVMKRGRQDKAADDEDSHAARKVHSDVDRNDAARKMRAALKAQMGQANEFNIG